eukprot:jgi/Mesvir1/16814/Mv15176-RA.1
MLQTSVENIKELFACQRQYINYFFENVDYALLRTFAQKVWECKGTCFFTGIGKSGFIAQKIAMTLASTGTKAGFLSAVDALHGDIGMVEADDMLVLISKSGATEEILKLIPAAKCKGAYLVGVTSIPGSKLERACDMHVILPLERELCPFDLAPVTSTALQMLFGDTIAIALMQERQLTKEQYALNHPAGRIGKRLVLKVSDVMKSGDDLPLCKGEQKLVDVLVELSSKGCGCMLVVTDSMELLGTFTDGDLRRALKNSGGSVLERQMKDLMITHPRVVDVNAMAVDAMTIMETGKPVQFLPVLKDGSKLVGIVTIHQLVHAGL